MCRVDERHLTGISAPSLRSSPADMCESAGRMMPILLTDCHDTWYSRGTKEYATEDSTVSAWLGLISAVEHIYPW